MNKEERLREYINKDYSYINYKTGVEEGTDFDKFCIQHCKDIEELLEENEKLKADLQLHNGALKRENEAIHRVNDLEEVIDKALEYINNHLKQDMLSDFTGANYIQEYISEPDALLDILKEVE